MKSCCKESCNCDTTERKSRRGWLIALCCAAGLVAALQLALG